MESMDNTAMEALWRTGHLSGGNSEYVEALYETFLVTPDQVSEEWRNFFSSLDHVGSANCEEVSHAAIKELFVSLGRNRSPGRTHDAGVAVDSIHAGKQVNIPHLISSYRVRGHQKASLDPLGIMHREKVPDLELAFHDFSSLDLGLSLIHI